VRRVVGFEGLARVASGPQPTPAVAPYVVTVDQRHLRLALADTGATVLDVPLTSVAVRRLGRAGAVVVEVDETPLLVDFTDRHAVPAHRVRGLVSRTARGLHGRGVRRRFVSAVEEPTS
jgi:hypothetical protein